MKMRELMRPQPWTVRATDVLGPVQRLMSARSIRHVPVMDGERCIGMLSERDVLRYRAKADADEEWWKVPVSDAMTSPVHTAGPEDSLTEVAGRLAAAQIGAMPIVELGKLLGLVTVTDVLDAEVRVAMAASPSPQTTATDIMTPAPVTIAPGDSLFEAAQIMVDGELRHIPVIDDRGHAIGMVSDRDVRAQLGDPVAAVQGWRNDAATSPRVRDAMTKPAIIIPEDRPLLQIAQMFADHQIGAVPVVSRAGTVVGIVSYVDVLRALLAR
jgi:acetoin utilization protein AcuB